MAGLWADRTGSYAAVWWIAVVLAALAALLHLVIDESPAPPAPAQTAGIGGFAPAGAAAIIVVAGAAAALSAQPADADAALAGSFICALHPAGP